MPIKNIFFDFGGCLDAPGLHGRDLLFQAFQEAKVLDSEEYFLFQEAYSKADKVMMCSGEVKDFGLVAFNRRNAELIGSILKKDRSNVLKAADIVSHKNAIFLERNRKVVEELAKDHILGVISNFAGNLQVILREFSLLPYFSSVTESFYEGCAKPEPEIFSRALKKSQAEAKNSIYIGDNPINDIAPARGMGFFTVLIGARPTGRETEPSQRISCLEELLMVTKKLDTNS